MTEGPSSHIRRECRGKVGKGLRVCVGQSMSWEDLGSEKKQIWDKHCRTWGRLGGGRGRMPTEPEWLGRF